MFDITVNCWFRLCAFCDKLLSSGPVTTADYRYNEAGILVGGGGGGYHWKAKWTFLIVVRVFFYFVKSLCLFDSFAAEVFDILNPRVFSWDTFRPLQIIIWHILCRYAAKPIKTKIKQHRNGIGYFSCFCEECILESVFRRMYFGEYMHCSHQNKRLFSVIWLKFVLSNTTDEIIYQVKLKKKSWADAFPRILDVSQKWSTVKQNHCKQFI